MVTIENVEAHMDKRPAQIEADLADPKAMPLTRLIELRAEAKQIWAARAGEMEKSDKPATKRIQQLKGVTATEASLNRWFEVKGAHHKAKTWLKLVDAELNIRGGPEAAEAAKRSAGAAEEQVGHARKATLVAIVSALIALAAMALTVLRKDVARPITSEPSSQVTPSRP